MPRDPRGGTPTLSPAEVLTILVWGAWRGGSTDRAKVYFHVQTYHRQEFPALGAYSKFVEATNRYSVELRTLLALMLHRNRQAQGASLWLFSPTRVGMPTIYLLKGIEAEAHRALQA